MTQFFNQHTVLFVTIGTWFVNTFMTAVVSSMPAPTKESGQGYTFLFKFANTLMGNISRAQASHVEGSPNWADALAKHKNGAV